MTEPESRTPSAWGLCPRCGSATPHRDGHDTWHDQLDAQLAALTDRLAQVEAQVADLLGTTTTDSGGII